MSQSGGGILPMYHSRPFSLGRRSRDKRILFIFLFVFSFICFSWLFLIPDSGNEPQRSYEQVYGDFAPHISNRLDQSVVRPPIPVPPITEYVRNEDKPKVNGDVVKEPEEVHVEETTEAVRADDSIQDKKNFVRKMMKHAWDGYEKFAWGQNELKPISKTGHAPPILGRASQIGLTLVDSLDTLWMMGMKEEFERAREWVKTQLELKVSADLSVFEMNIRYVGGFLSTYALTKDKLFLDKAKEVADLLLPAFSSGSGIPFSLVNPVSGGGKSWGWAGGSSILAEIGTLHLEFLYLSYATKDPKYYEKVLKIRNILKALPKSDGLYPNYINPNSGTWGQSHVSLGALGDSFYEYLYKTYILTSKTDEDAKQMYYDAMEAIRSHLIKRSSTGLVYAGDLRNGRTESKMDHLGCFSGGLFALSSKDAPRNLKKEYLQLGEELTSTCHESYIRSDTRLGPEAFYFNGGQEARASRQNEYVYLLRPETVESYFILWRVTKNEKYRDWAWDVVQALEQHARTENGYSGIRSVYSVPAQHDDVQQSFFLAETLKYLYLIFCADSEYRLDEWVFNTEAHPLPMIPGLSHLP